MQQTVFDLDTVSAHSLPNADCPRRRPDYGLVTVALLLIATVALIAVLAHFSQSTSPSVLQRTYTLPSPQPLNPPPPALPTVTVTMPPPAPVVRIPPPRRSLWEIRAELKRGLGEWEFPHYVNAPHYGSGPSSPLPSPLRPHIATAYAQ